VIFVRECLCMSEGGVGGAMCVCVLLGMRFHTSGLAAPQIHWRSATSHTRNPGSREQMAMAKKPGSRWGVQLSMLLSEGSLG